MYVITLVIPHQVIMGHLYFCTLLTYRMALGDRLEGLQSSSFLSESGSIGNKEIQFTMRKVG